MKPNRHHLEMARIASAAVATLKADVARSGSTLVSINFDTAVNAIAQALADAYGPIEHAGDIYEAAIVLKEKRPRLDLVPILVMRQDMRAPKKGKKR